MILVDTKYEFGTDATGRIVLADEIHTPDSSRYWIASGYEQAFANGTRPLSFDKDVIRSGVVARCDPYHDPIPEIPAEMIAQTAAVRRFDSLKRWMDAIDFVALKANEAGAEAGAEQQPPRASRGDRARTGPVARSLSARSRAEH